VYKIWNKAQDMWLSSLLKDKIKYLVLIEINIPLLTPFKDNLIGIRKSLLVIAIEIKKIAKRFY